MLVFESESESESDFELLPEFEFELDGAGVGEGSAVELPSVADDDDELCPCKRPPKSPLGGASRKCESRFGVAWGVKP